MKLPLPRKLNRPPFYLKISLHLLLVSFFLPPLNVQASERRVFAQRITCETESPHTLEAPAFSIPFTWLQANAFIIHEFQLTLNWFMSLFVAPGISNVQYSSEVEVLAGFNIGSSHGMPGYYFPLVFSQLSDSGILTMDAPYGQIGVSSRLGRLPHGQQQLHQNLIMPSGPLSLTFLCDDLEFRYSNLSIPGVGYYSARPSAWANLKFVLTAF